MSDIITQEHQHIPPVIYPFLSKDANPFLLSLIARLAEVIRTIEVAADRLIFTLSKFYRCAKVCSDDKEIEMLRKESILIKKED